MSQKWKIPWLALAIVGSVIAFASTGAAADSITTPDTTGDTGFGPDMVLDNNGYPVIAYFNRDSRDLVIMHCNDPDCAGGNESITVPDSGGNVGQQSSLVLDADGYPVVSYYDSTNGDLKLLRCDDPNCDGTGEVVATLDSSGSVGFGSALALDSNDYPIIAYKDTTNADLKVIHCTSAACNNTPTITVVDSVGSVGDEPDIVLDAAGNPVITYYASSGADLKVLRCADPTCSGAGSTITAPDSTGTTGRQSSVALDANDVPVISYLDATQDTLKVMHCDDPTCDGNGEVIATPDSAVDVGLPTSLVLDDAGLPVVAYGDRTAGRLKILRCDDPFCVGGGESIVTADSVVDIGFASPIALDDESYPVVAYYDEIGEDLRVLHCDDAFCAPLLCNGLTVTVVLADGDVPTNGDDVILGTPTDDVINGLSGNDTICGEGGDDTIFGGDGDDTILGGNGDDTILGQADNDTIFGGANRDSISGNAGNDTLHGEGGGDIVFAGSGDDTVTGGLGNDTLGGASGTDTINGDDGNDTISGGSDNDGTINGNDGNDAVNGGGGNDNNVNGDAGDDTVSGNGGKDVVNGNDGDDEVRGGQGDDLVLGGDGDDFVAGNEDADTCDGGTTGEVLGDVAASNCEVILNVP